MTDLRTALANALRKPSRILVSELVLDELLHQRPQAPSYTFSGIPLVVYPDVEGFVFEYSPDTSPDTRPYTCPRILHDSRIRPTPCHR